MSEAQSSDLFFSLSALLPWVISFSLTPFNIIHILMTPKFISLALIALLTLRPIYLTVSLTSALECPSQTELVILPQHVCSSSFY